MFSWKKSDKTTKKSVVVPVHWKGFQLVWRHRLHIVSLIPAALKTLIIESCMSQQSTEHEEVSNH